MGKRDKNNKLKLTEILDGFDWAALGIAVCGIVMFLHLVVLYISKGI